MTELARRAELIAVEAKNRKSTAELKATVLAGGSRPMDLHGVGAVVAARLLVQVGDITRFPDRNHCASWNGSAPIDASSAMSCATGCPGQATVRSTGCCTPWTSCS